MVARALQGVFGALLTPAALAMIVATFPPDERGKAVGAWTAWGGIGTVLGPLIGGQLVDAASWRWIFAINIPIVLITLVPRDARHGAGRPRPRGGARWTIVGAALCALGLAGITYGLIEQPRNGWGDPGVWLPLAAGVAPVRLRSSYGRRAAATRCSRSSLFRRRNFTIGNIETFSMYAGLGLLFFFLVLFLQQVAGYDALEAGSTTHPGHGPDVPPARPASARSRTATGRASSWASGRSSRRSGWRWFMRLDADVDYLTDLLPGLLVFALGLSMTVAPLTATVLADADESNAGIASGVNNAIARVASLIAIAAVGASRHGLVRVVAARRPRPGREPPRRERRDQGGGEAAARPGAGAERAAARAGAHRATRRATPRSTRSTSRSASRPAWSRSAACSAWSGS